MNWLWNRRRILTIDNQVWPKLSADLPLLAAMPPGDTALLRERMAQFLSQVTVSGVQDLLVTDAMRLQVAAQACLPILQLGLGAYDAFSEVVLYPDRFKVRRRIDGPDGTVTEFEDALLGEAISGGPVVLSWADALVHPSHDPATNLVIHEFAHKLDLADGEADGCPPMSERQRSRWMETLLRAFDDFNWMIDRVEAAIPGDVDPESAQADPWYALLPLDPYAGTNPAEFFAVSTERFFVDPITLQAEFPALSAEYRQYFGLDPCLWQSGRRSLSALKGQNPAV